MKSKQNNWQGTDDNNNVELGQKYIVRLYKNINAQTSKNTCLVDPKLSLNLTQYQFTLENQLLI